MRMSVGIFLALCMAACGQENDAQAQDTPAFLIEPDAGEPLPGTFAAADEFENIELVSSTGIQLVRSANGTLFINGIEIGTCMAGIGVLSADLAAELDCTEAGFELTAHSDGEAAVTFSLHDAVNFQIKEAAGQSDFELAEISLVPLSEPAMAFINQSDLPQASE